MTAEPPMAPSGPVARTPRRLRAAALLVGALALAGAGADGVRGDPPGPADPLRVPEEAYPAALRQRVVEALTKGSEHLWGLQKPDGSWPESRFATTASYPEGPTALALHALLEAGARADDPRVERGFAYLRPLPHASTYSAASTLLALRARHATRRAEYSDLLSAEEPDDPGPREALRRRENRPDLELARRCLETVLGAQQPSGGWAYRPGQVHWDLSNTQYGMLGLRAARDLGLEVKRAAWQQAFRFLLDWQQEDGPDTTLRTALVEGSYRLVFSEPAQRRGFGYMPASPTEPKVPYATTTASGLASLLLARSELEGSARFTAKDRESVRVAVRDGLAWLTGWLEEHTSGHGAGGIAEFDYYFLYALERVGVLARLRHLGTLDWYVDGAWLLVDTQRADGGWGGNLVLDTAWAMLFLKRASFRARRGAVTPATDPGAPGAGSALETAEGLARGGLLTTEDGLEREDAERVRAGLELLLRALDAVRKALAEPGLAASDRTVALTLEADLEGRIDEAREWLAEPPAPPPAPVPVPPGPPPVLGPTTEEPEAGSDAEPSPSSPSGPVPAPVPAPAPAPPAPRPTPAPPVAPPPVAPPPAAPAPAPPSGAPRPEAYPSLTDWVYALRAYWPNAPTAERAALASMVADRAGFVGLPLLLRRFDDETDASARAALHAALARLGTARVATAMTRYTRADGAARRTDAVDVLCRCLEKPEKMELERPFVRAVRRFHRLKDRRLSRQILDRLWRMGPEGVAALGQVLYVDDFGFHDLTIARLATCKDGRAVPPLVYKMNRFLFEYRVQLPAHQALLQIGWHAVPELINRLDDKAAGIWISWTLRRITTETMGTDKRKWHDWWKSERVRHPEVTWRDDEPSPGAPAR